MKVNVFIQCSVMLAKNDSSTKDAIQYFYHILYILGNIKAEEFGNL